MLPPIALGIAGLRGLERRQRPGSLPRLPAGTPLPAAPRHDPEKPTVAVLLGADLTEITDALGPYEMFARAGVFNVYAVAPERQPTLLSGGLPILPHLSLSELDGRLEGRPPAIVVVPMIPNIASNQNRPLVQWMQRQAARGALMHSWCTGAMALAEAGLLDGLTATAHWGDLARLEKRYPRVKWVRGVHWGGPRKGDHLRRPDVRGGRLASSAVQRRGRRGRPARGPRAAIPELPPRRQPCRDPVHRPAR